MPVHPLSENVWNWSALPFALPPCVPVALDEYAKGDVLFLAEQDAFRFERTALRVRPLSSPLQCAWGFSATRCADGAVLVAGGIARGIAVPSTWFFDPTCDDWKSGPILTQPRHGHAATLLPDGHVLVLGGRTSEGAAIPYAEWLTPSGFSPVSDTAVPFAEGTPLVVVLRDSRLLVLSEFLVEGRALIFTPDTRTWSACAPLPIRSGAVSALFPVGAGALALMSSGHIALYDPIGDQWSHVPRPAGLRPGHIATLGSDWLLYVSHQCLDAWLFHPASLQWTEAPRTHRQRRATLVPLSTGEALLFDPRAHAGAAEVEIFCAPTHAEQTVPAGSPVADATHEKSAPHTWSEQDSWDLFHWNESARPSPTRSQRAQGERLFERLSRATDVGLEALSATQVTLRRSAVPMSLGYDVETVPVAPVLYASAAAQRWTRLRLDPACPMLPADHPLASADATIRSSVGYDLEAVWKGLAGAPTLPRLRALHMGPSHLPASFSSDRTDDIARSKKVLWLGDVRNLFDIAPSTRRLSLTCNGVGLGDWNAPELRSLSLRCGSLSALSVRRLATSHMPQLHAVLLQIAGPSFTGYYDDACASPEEITALLHAPSTSLLRVCLFEGYFVTPEWVRLLADAGFFRRMRVVGFPHVVKSDAMTHVLAEARPKSSLTTRLLLPRDGWSEISRRTLMASWGAHVRFQL